LAIVLFLFSSIGDKSFAADVLLKAKETHQTMEGFGASIAWADDQRTSHPQYDEIYNYIFNDLGLDILRHRNIYQGNPNYFADILLQ
jgi:glucuronoarabinoxylan endo-1,4-beta-xylanase